VKVPARRPGALVVRGATLAEVFPLRHAELRPGFPPDAARFDGDDEPTTRHFGAFLGDAGALVGCASFMRRPWRGEPAWQLRGMATRADHVRRGIGTRLLRFAEETLRAAGELRLLWCNARLTAVPFYERVGWVIASDVFDVPTVGPHRVMVHRMPP
jgi:GNAT superfamily N-acetyltransferase